MKRILNFAAVLLALLTCSCVKEQAVPLKGISLNKVVLNLKPGEDATLSVSFNPADATDIPEVSWTSSDNAVATVSDGKVTAVGGGSATITAKAGTFEASCSVNVKSDKEPEPEPEPEPKPELESIALDRAELSLKCGEEATLAVIFSPADAADIPEVNWESSDNSVASVSEGKVKAIAAGNATITAVAGAFSASCAVTVKAEDPEPGPEIPELPDTPEETIVPRSEPVSFDNCDDIKYQAKRAQADGTDAGISHEGQKEGSGWFKRHVGKGAAEWVKIVRGTDIVNARIFSVNRGHLAFWLWLDPDVTMAAGGVERNIAEHIRNRFASNALTEKSRVELSHANTGGDRQKIEWSFKEIAQDLQPGWNLVDLAFKDAKVSEGYSLNPEGLNWMRIIMDGPAPNWDEYSIGIDDIVVYEDYAETSATKSYLHYLSNVDGWLAATSPNYHSKVGYNANEKSVGAQFPAADFSILQMSLASAVNPGISREKGHLHFKMYISDISALSDHNGQLEIGSAGIFDEDELHWGTNSFLKFCHSGWNDIVLDLNRTGEMGSCNLNAINWFRFYNKSTGDVLIKFKDIYFYEE